MADDNAVRNNPELPGTTPAQYNSPSRSPQAEQLQLAPLLFYFCLEFLNFAPINQIHLN